MSILHSRLCSNPGSNTLLTTFSLICRMKRTLLYEETRQEGWFVWRWGINGSGHFFYQILIFAKKEQCGYYPNFDFGFGYLTRKEETRMTPILEFWHWGYKLNQVYIPDYFSAIWLCTKVIKTEKHNVTTEWFIWWIAQQTCRCLHCQQ